ncbi:protein APEM9 isoform X1 [Ricinus communis]|uniref:protein APEM9 isoform X1 n=1 Tax=Ricinus communis TaxID=3988 RepID=UPI00201A33BB|nr:protein APEM9 isoform X1 [Ricinus communis]XP_015581887.2 protein APEM9 isoform X1 [Ricinus communis]
MALMDSNPATWEEIERSESYLVASMYEEAASVASSVLNKICNKNSINSNVKDQGGEEFELNDMMLSAGMVLVQSLSQLGRGSDILKELKQLFMSVDAIPVQVLLTGVCFQISEGSLLGVREFLEEFLGKWNFVEGRHYVLVDARIDANLQEGYDKSSILGVDEYMEVAEIYAVTLLGTALKDLDLAISWVEKAALPEERQQGLLRRLHSLYSLKATNSSQGSSLLPANDHDNHRLLSKKLDVSEESSEVLESKYLPNGETNVKQEILTLSRRVNPCLWWFRTINLKFGNARLVISNGKILLGCLAFLIYYVLRRKQATLKGIVRRQFLFIKKALVDIWQLGFSYQVNPLAAVQPLPAATRGGR